MNGTSHAGEGSTSGSSGAKASLTASFTLHADREQDVATAAAELIRRLQEMASLPRCAYDLDVDVQWPAARALAPGGADVPLDAGRPPGSR